MLTSPTIKRKITTQKIETPTPKNSSDNLNKHEQEKKISEEKRLTETTGSTNLKNCNKMYITWRQFLIIIVLILSLIFTFLFFCYWEQALWFLFSFFCLSWSISELVQCIRKKDNYRLYLSDGLGFLLWLIPIFYNYVISVETPPSVSEQLNARFFGVEDHNKYDIPIYDNSQEDRNNLKLMIGLDNSEEGFGLGTKRNKNLLPSDIKEDKYNSYINDIQEFIGYQSPVHKLAGNSKDPICWGDFLQVRLCYDLLQLYNTYKNSAAKFIVLTIGDNTKQLYPSIQSKFSEFKLSNVRNAMLEILELKNDEQSTDIDDFYEKTWGEISKDSINAHTIYVYSDFFHDTKKQNGGNVTEENRQYINDKGIVQIYMVDIHSDSKERRERNKFVLDTIFNPKYERQYTVNYINRDEIIPHMVNNCKQRTWFYDSSGSIFNIEIPKISVSNHIRMRSKPISGTFWANEHRLNDQEFKLIGQRDIKLRYDSSKDTQIKKEVEFEIHHNNICYIIPLCIYPLLKINPCALTLVMIVSGGIFSLLNIPKKKKQS
jgi:hypothetical protein